MRLRVDPAVVIREQRGNHGADVIGQADATEGGDFGDVFVDLGIIADEAAGKIGGDGSGGRRC